MIGATVAVRLVTVKGEPLCTGRIATGPSFQEPDVLIWGPNIFVRAAADDAGVTYREAVADVLVDFDRPAEPRRTA